MRFVPADCNSSETVPEAPVPRATIAITAATRWSFLASSTPCAAYCDSAPSLLCENSSEALFVPERLHGRYLRSLPGRIVAEEDSNRCGHSESKRHRHQRNG